MTGDRLLSPQGHKPVKTAEACVAPKTKLPLSVLLRVSLHLSEHNTAWGPSWEVSLWPSDTGTKAEWEGEGTLPEPEGWGTWGLLMPLLQNAAGSPSFGKRCPVLSFFLRLVIWIGTCTPSIRSLGLKPPPPSLSFFSLVSGSPRPSSSSPGRGLPNPGRKGLHSSFFSCDDLSSLPPLSSALLPAPLRPEALWEETRCRARAARGEARSAGPGGLSQWGARMAARAAGGGRGRGAISGGAARRPRSAVERSGAER